MVRAGGGSVLLLSVVLCSWGLLAGVPRTVRLFSANMKNAVHAGASSKDIICTHASNAVLLACYHSTELPFEPPSPPTRAIVGSMRSQLLLGSNCYQNYSGKCICLW